MREPQRRARLFSVFLVIVTLVTGVPVSAGPTGGALPPELVQIVQIGGRYGIPPDAEMIAANVTAVGAAEPGFLTVFACDESIPATSNVNYLADQVVPNLVFSRLAPNGTICVATGAVTDLLVDVVGYVPAGSLLTPLQAPVRAVDTRGAAAAGPSRPAGSVLEIPIAGRYGVASDATVVLFNATVIAGSQPGFVTAYPCGSVPSTSSVNFLPEHIVPNLVTARLSASGSLCIYTLAPADIVVDIAAYATAGIEPLDVPVRVLDTRLAGTRAGGGTVTTVDLGGRADVPDDAAAAVYNLTSVGATGNGFATSYPCDAERPLASNLNYSQGGVVANGSVTKLAANGTMCIFTLADTHLLVDLVGTTRGVAHYVPITPVRAVDTREGWRRRCDWVATWTVPPNPSALPTIYAHNFVTDQTITFTAPQIPLASPAISQGCDAVLLLTGPSLAPVQGASGLWRLGFDGTRSLSPLPALQEGLVDSRARRLITFEDGAIGMFDGTNLWDLATWTRSPVLDFAVVDGSNTYTLTTATMSADRSTIAAIYTSVMASRSLVVVSDVATGVVSTTPIDNVVSLSIDVTADGTYVVVDVFELTSQERATVVMTRFGDIVDGARGTGVSTEARFVGSGAIVVCVGPIGLFTWDLFGPIEQVAELSELQPGQFGSCAGFDA